LVLNRPVDGVGGDVGVMVVGLEATVELVVVLVTYRSPVLTQGFE